MTTARYRPAPDIGVIDLDGVVYIAPLPDGPIRVLDDVAGAIWRTACTPGSEPVAERVARIVNQPASAIAAHVDDFLTELTGRGYLIAADPAR